MRFRVERRRTPCVVLRCTQDDGSFLIFAIAEFDGKGLAGDLVEGFGVRYVVFMFSMPGHGDLTLSSTLRTFGFLRDGAIALSGKKFSHCGVGWQGGFGSWRTPVGAIVVENIERWRIARGVAYRVQLCKT
jgi:hypothetical protein